MIVLTNNLKHEFEIDADDFAKIFPYKWHVGNGYVRRTVRNNKEYRQVALHTDIMNTPKGLCVDHINGDGLYCRKSNMRICDAKRNSWNQKKARNGKTSEYRGVHYCKRNKRFIARICVNGKRTTLGYFFREIDAAYVYDIEAKRLYGRFAKLNLKET